MLRQLCDKLAMCSALRQLAFAVSDKHWLRHDALDEPVDSADWVAAAERSTKIETWSVSSEWSEGGLENRAHVSS